MNTIIPKDYYDYMYDIEDLTDLNAGHVPKVSNLVVKTEVLVKDQKCTNALRLLRTAKSDDYHAEMIRMALWIKQRLFKDIIYDTEDKSPKKCALEELGKYLNVDAEELQKKMRVELPVEEDWKAMNINEDDAEDVVRFYKESNSYVYELMAANHIIQTLYTFSKMTERMQKLGVQNILDYGAGAGTLCILLKQLGYDVTYADLPGKTYNFAQWRFQQRDISIPMHELNGNEKTDLSSTVEQNKKVFDCILSTEVVEHVSHPIDLLQSFYVALPVGGVLVVSESCEYTEQFSSHLESNKQYGGEKFLRIMEEIGFKLQEFDSFIPQQIFVKQI